MSEPLGKIQQPQLGRETHPQAIYYHAGNGYLVTGIDQALNEVNVVPYSRPYYTKPKIEAEVTIIEELAGAALTRPGSDAVFGRLSVDEHVAGYKIYEQPPARKMIAEHALSKPVTHLLNTKGFVLRLDPALQHFLHDHAPHDPVADFPDPLYDALHGLEHLLVELLPSVALCDRRDIAGWVPQDPFTDLSAKLCNLRCDRRRDWPGRAGVQEPRSSACESNEHARKLSMHRRLPALPANRLVPPAQRSPEQGRDAHAAAGSARKPALARLSMLRLVARPATCRTRRPSLSQHLVTLPTRLPRLNPGDLKSSHGRCINMRCKPEAGRNAYFDRLSCMQVGLSTLTRKSNSHA